MAQSYIRYDILTIEALRGVVRTVLADAAKNGLPGEHYFQIAFDTTAPGVQLSERMRAQYPQEMMIVLQHQFWDLNVTDDTFEVGLSFGGVAELVRVPFDALVAFQDPVGQFGVKFEPAEGAVNDEHERAETNDASIAGPKTPDALPAAAQPEPETPRAEKESGAEVVRLDRFRKK